MWSNKTLLLGLLGAAMFGQANAATYDEIKARGEMVIAVYRDYPPFSFRRGEELVGIDVDIAKAVAGRLKLKPVFREQTAGESVSDDLRNAVWKGHYLDHTVADIMLHIPVDREFMQRNSEAYIFAPYYRDMVAVTVDSEQIPHFSGLDVFLEKKVGVELGTLADQYLLTIHDGHLINNVVHYRSVDKAITGMIGTEVAGVMGSRSEIEDSLAKSGRKFAVTPMTLPGIFNGEWVIGMAVKNNNHQLANEVEDAVDELIKDGTIPTIFKSAGLSYVPSYEKQK